MQTLGMSHLVFLLYWCLNHSISRSNGLQEIFKTKSVGGSVENIMFNGISKFDEEFTNFHQATSEQDLNLLSAGKSQMKKNLESTSEENYYNQFLEDILVPKEWDNNMFLNPPLLSHNEKKQEAPMEGRLITNQDYMLHENSYNLPSFYSQLKTNFNLHQFASSQSVDELYFSGSNPFERNFPQTNLLENQIQLPQTSQSTSGGIFHDLNNRNPATNLSNKWYPLLPVTLPNHYTLQTQEKEKIEPVNFSDLTQTDSFYKWSSEVNNIGHDKDILSEVLKAQKANGISTLSKELMSHGSEPIKTDTKTNLTKKSRKKEGPQTSAKFKTPGRKEKKPKKLLKSETTAIERIELIKILQDNFTIEPIMENMIKPATGFSGSRESAKKQKYDIFEVNNAFNAKILEFIADSNIEEGNNFEIKGEVNMSNKNDSMSKAIINKRGDCIFKCAMRIHCNDCWAIYKKLEEISSNFKTRFNTKELFPNKNFEKRVKTINFLGVNFMKIISKLYPENSRSKEFLNDQSLFEYSEAFWGICLSNNNEMDKRLKIFIQSIKIFFESKPDKSLMTKKNTAFTKIIFNFTLRQFLSDGILYFVNITGGNNKKMIIMK
ncbi:hypothetical protein PPACK8108_LOCUS19773 [Phakopsora pachyrhizi]|uniref:Uncharacterized protein n=1 Tax=Phakopsora pachyrhizi TaxID=170000 RepID=A0AAV0BH66_PHAPC|nr:hypothetical protein PPACK8108_LOCUS19773 [Phakopsora pachyrhizi]